MKVYRILLAAGAAALLLLAGCTREMKTAAVSDEGEVPMQGFDASMSYDYRMEYITGGVPKQVMDKINNHIIRYDILYDEEETSTDVPAACRQWADGQVSTYEADASEFAEDFDEDDAWMFNWSFSIDGSFETACKERGWQTYATASEDYTGGAHGSYFLSYTVFDMKTGEVVTEEDFLDMEIEELSDLIYDKVLEEIDEDMWDAIYETPHPNGNFRVDDEGVCWVFNPYEIGPYVLGSLDAFVSWEELAPYMLAR